MTEPEPVLSDQTRDALTDELFARWDALEPDKGHCFSGGDGDLVDAVNELRGRAADQIGDDG